MCLCIYIHKHTKTNIAWSHLYVESKQTKHQPHKKIRFVVTRGSGVREKEELEEGGKSGQTLVIRYISARGVMYHMMAMVNTAIWQKDAKRVDPRVLISRRFFFPSSFYCICMRSWMLTQPMVAIISQYCMYWEIHPIYLKLIQWCISILFNKTTRKHFWFSKLMNKRQYLCRLYWTTKYFKWNRGTKYLFSWVCFNKLRGTKMQTNEQLEGLSDHVWLLISEYWNASIRNEPHNVICFLFSMFLKYVIDHVYIH